MWVKLTDTCIFTIDVMSIFLALNVISECIIQADNLLIFNPAL